MSGLLGALLGVATIAVSIFTYNPYGIAAGALMIAGAAAQSGLLGKGAQNFENSSVGKDLTMAVGLASAAMSVASLASASDTLAASSSTIDANAAAEGADAATAPAADASTVSGIASNGEAAAAPAASNVPAFGGALPSDMAAPAASVSATSNEAVTNPFQMAQSFQSDPGAVDSSLSPSNINATNQLANGQALSGGTGGVGGTPIDGNAVRTLQGNLNLGSAPSQAETAASSADTTAVKPLSGPATPPAGAGGLPPGDPGETSIAGAGAGPPATPAQGGQPSGMSGLLSKAGTALSTPQGMLMGGSALSGLASGISQQKMMQEQIAAQQWGNMQWQQPGQVAQLQAAAASPINVPMGYLNRAAAVRNLMNSGGQQTAPLQSAPPPAVGAPALPTPGAGAASGSGPVPIAGMNAQPRGGVI